MMIDRLVIADFQCHAKLDLRLNPGVTAVVGASDVGKSAVLRALRWLALNAPSGVEFVRHGAKQANVALRVGGTWVQRRRSKAENVYQVADGDPHQLERGGAVPKAVADLLNVGPVNFAGQHDPPFWLSDTPGRVAQALNEIVSLQEIDDVTAKAQAGVRDAQAQVKAAEREQKEADGELERLPDPTRVLSLLDRAERLADEYGDVVRRRTSLGEAVAAVERASARVAVRRRVGALAEKAEEAVGRLEETRRQIAALKKALSDLAAARSRADVDWQKWDRLLEVRRAADAAADRRGALEAALDDYEKARDRACRANQRLEQAESELATLAAAFGGQCPLCGQPADPSQFSSATPTSDPGPLAPEARTRGAGVDFR